ncbi:MAG: diguanylate cyclase [Kamptonema sp. SIO4C4]|nr:diguanylate cyclase [Kamptonema sp. SIO4C4]
MSKPYQQFGLVLLISLWAGLGITGLVIGFTLTLTDAAIVQTFWLKGGAYCLILSPVISGLGGFFGWRFWARNLASAAQCQYDRGNCAIQAEQALQDSEKRFRAIFEQAAVGMVLITLEGHFFRVNQTVCHILGYDRPELLALKFNTILPTAKRDYYQTAIAQLKQGQLPHLSQETQLLHKNGMPIWIKMTLALVQDQQTQQPKYFLGVFENIHRRKEVETALRESEERFRQLAETVQDVFWLYDPQTEQILYVNQAYEQIWGRPCETIYNRPFSWLEAVYPDDQPMVKASLQSQFHGITTEKEFRILRPDGEMRWICDRAFPILNEQGVVDRIAGIATDITERKQTEQTLADKQHFIEKIANLTPNILYIYDLIEQRNIYSNQEINSLLGYSQDAIAQMGPQLFAQLMHPEDLTRLANYHQQFQAAQDGDILEIEYRLKDIHGQWHWLISRDTIFSRTPDGKPRQILGTASDITERKLAEAALLNANLQLQDKVHELEMRNAEMQCLEDMNEFLQVCSSVQEAYEGLATYLQPMFPNCTGVLYVLNRENQKPTVVTSWGKLSSINYTSPLPDRLAPWLDFPDHCCSDAQVSLAHNYLCIPMIALGETLGHLYIQGQAMGELAIAKRRFARTVTEHLALALANLELRENLRSQSLRDPLTGLYNRRYMEEALTQELRRAQRGEHTVGIILLDVDRFKQFNDTFGHNAGDRVLRVLSHFLKRNIRQSDVVCRYGGEELLLILPEATLADSYQRAEQIRQRVERLKIKHHGQRLGSVTISVGISGFPDHGETGEDLIQAADKALYQAKHQGRNCTVVYGVLN